MDERSVARTDADDRRQKEDAGSSDRLSVLKDAPAQNDAVWSATRAQRADNRAQRLRYQSAT